METSMKALLIAAALVLPATALAQSGATPREEPSFHAQLYERYCDKLRESPVAYVQFVRRMQPVYGYTYTDFAPERRGDPVRADCRVSPERMAEVSRQLRGDAR
jgi:hypothetical protein